jgi:uncharacterized membrane protein YraQ (UPF0718 family)
MHLHRLTPNRADGPTLALVFALALLWLLAYNALQPMADWLTYTLLGLSPLTAAGSAVNFFLYDTPKLLLLLSCMIFVITLLQSFIPPDRVKRLVSHQRAGVGNLMAAAFGALTPFCSCSSVPLFIGFVESGIPLGITFSFLITSPIMNEVAFVLLIGMFGWKVALLYLVSGLAIGVVSGVIIGRLKLERYVEDFVYKVKVTSSATQDDAPLSWSERVQQAAEQTRSIVLKVLPFVLVGIGIGALIHGYVPQDALADIMGSEAWWSVPAAVVVGIPLYSNAAGVVPVISVLIDKGASIGTVLAFMMAVVALSVPELIILRRVLKPQLIAVFVFVVALGIIFTGYLFNAVL